MIRRNPRGDLPQIDPTSFVDHTALIIGKVIVGANVFIGPYAVIRADEVNEQGDMEPIIIGDHSNIQDGVVIHSKAGAAVTIGSRTSIAHRSIIHGPAQIGDQCFIGFNSVIFDCHVGAYSVIRHNSVVEHVDLPEKFHVPSCTVVQKDADLTTFPQVSADARDFSESVVATNRELVAGYKKIANEF